VPSAIATRSVLLPSAEFEHRRAGAKVLRGDSSRRLLLLLPLELLELLEA
jgi:hypothetical protein